MELSLDRNLPYARLHRQSDVHAPEKSERIVQESGACIQMVGSSENSVALIADEHELFRAGASAMLLRDCGFSSVLEAASLADALALLNEEPAVSLACFDLALPGVGTPLDLKQVREHFPNVLVTVFTAFESRENILLALESGLHGFVPKTLATPEIVKAFQLIVSGVIYVPPTITELPPPDKLAAVRTPTFGTSLPTVGGALSGAKLTKRQQEILRLIRNGRSNREIGWRLGLSENTVKVHTNALYKKLHVHSRFQAAALTLSGSSDSKDD